MKRWRRRLGRGQTRGTCVTKKVGARPLLFSTAHGWRQKGRKSDGGERKTGKDGQGSIAKNSAIRTVSPAIRPVKL